MLCPPVPSPWLEIQASSDGYSGGGHRKERGRRWILVTRPGFNVFSGTISEAVPFRLRECHGWPEVRRAASFSRMGEYECLGRGPEAGAGGSTAVHLLLLGVTCALMLLTIAPGVHLPPSSVPEAAPAVPQPAGPVPLLVTKESPLEPLQFNPENLVFSEGVQVSAAAAPDLAAMLSAARGDGVFITVVSGYRSYTEQATLHESYVAALGIEAAGELSAQAGHSEHQTGLAVDIADSSGVCALGDCFAHTPAGVWSAANAWKFGFIVRYPAGARAITGYTYEPWHLRHVGTSVSAAMHHRGTATLEEFLGQTTGPHGDVSP